MRRIKSARISFLSLCPKGKNRFETIYKDDDSIALSGICKASEDFDEKGELVACVWAPNRLDAENDWCDAPVVKEMAHSFMRDGKGVDVRHDEKVLPRESAFVAESFIIQKGDPRFEDLKDYDGNSVGDVSGGWGVVVKLDSAELRQSYRRGEWAGISMGGVALTDRTPPPITKENGDEDMASLTKEELVAVLADSNKALVADLAKSLKPESKEEKVEKKEEETFELDLNDPEAIQKHLDALELKQINKNDPKALRKRLIDLKKSKSVGADDGGEADEGDEGDEAELSKAEAEVERLKAQLRKAEGRSNAPDADKVKGSRISKEDKAAIEAGRSVAAIINKSLGTAKS